ncbi:MAG: protein phosphatase 2C domain-containing protein [Deltaproteobacteria bacterium]|nr:protein phosphatase 2C domain-containing protein [Deltaproteobacteria bacterium]
MSEHTTTVVASAATHVGNVREHNEDAHVVDIDLGLFAVCDGMGGHAAGEVASGLASRVVRERWGGREVQAAARRFAQGATPDAKKALIDTIRRGVYAAHSQIIAEAHADPKKRGMGTTFVGCLIAGGAAVFAHAGDSRAYLVRDGIAIQLTEDHTLLARLAAAGIDVGAGGGEESRWKGVLTNALGIGDRTTVPTFVLPLDPGDRFLLCSDGISEYVTEPEVGAVLSSQPSPGRAAQKLVELALERGGADNATAIVIKVLEVGTIRVPPERRERDNACLAKSRFLGGLSAAQRLRALRIATERELGPEERVPAATLGDRVAWLILDGQVERDGQVQGPGDLVYPESLLPERPSIDKDHLAQPRGTIRALAFRRDDFAELTIDDGDLAEPLFGALANLLGST